MYCVCVCVLKFLQQDVGLRFEVCAHSDSGNSYIGRALVVQAHLTFGDGHGKGLKDPDAAAKELVSDDEFDEL